MVVLQLVMGTKCLLCVSTAVLSQVCGVKSLPVVWLVGKAFVAF